MVTIKDTNRNTAKGLIDMKTIAELHNLEDHELINEVLKLQESLREMDIKESVCSQIHNYHFASNELLKLTKARFSGSGIILGGIYSLSGKCLMKPLTISGGLSNNTINGLLDDIQDTFDYKTEFKPTTNRL